MTMASSRFGVVALNNMTMFSKTLLFCTLFASALTVGAQSAQSDPVLMTVNGKAVTRAEFEYSYNKNGNVEGAVERKSVEEYVPMFVNYKLKVEAALAARLDTLSSFKKEFHTYRDMQLTPFMVDQTFIDSVALSIYNRTAERLGGHDLIRPAHILIKLKQDAGETERAAAKAKADSIYAALKAGADFAELAKSHSADPGTARVGGQLPLIGPGATVKEFEDAAYALKTGETSEPVLSPFGYHIIRMTERKPLDPYSTLKPEIIEALKKQNIEEISAEQRIAKIVAASKGRLTREEVLDSVMQANIKNNAELRYLIQEYHDGLLLYEVSKREVWDVAASDKQGLERWYKTHKKKYAWEKPHFKGFVFHTKDAKLKKKIIKLLKKNADGDWRLALKKAFNADSMVVMAAGPYLCVEGENKYVDVYAFKNGKQVQPYTGFLLSGVSGKVQKQPKSYIDVKSEVVNDYQMERERQWVENVLRKKFTFSVNNDVLSTVNKH